MRKIQRQVYLSVIQPPSVGPIDGAHIAVTPYTENASPLFSGGNVSARIAWAIGCRPPPPAPRITRDSRRMPSDGAMPQKSELTVNNEMQIRKNRLRPITNTSQPVIGSTIAFETR